MVSNVLMPISNGYKFYAEYLMPISNGYKFYAEYLMPISNGSKGYNVLMPISNGYKFYYVYALWFFIFGRGPCHIVVLRGPVPEKGPNRLKINNLGQFGPGSARKKIFFILKKVLYLYWVFDTISRSLDWAPDAPVIA